MKQLKYLGKRKGFKIGKDTFKGGNLSQSYDFSDGTAEVTPEDAWFLTQANPKMFECLNGKVTRPVKPGTIPKEYTGPVLLTYLGKKKDFKILKEKCQADISKDYDFSDKTIPVDVGDAVKLIAINPKMFDMQEIKAAEPKDLENMTKKELLEEAATCEGLEFDARMTKATLIGLIEDFINSNPIEVTGDGTEDDENEGDTGSGVADEVDKETPLERMSDSQLNRVILDTPGLEANANWPRVKKIMAIQKHRELENDPNEG